MQNMLWCAFCQVSALVLKKVILSQLSPIPHPSFDQKNSISCNEKMFLKYLRFSPTFNLSFALWHVSSNILYQLLQTFRIITDNNR